MADPIKVESLIITEFRGFRNKRVDFIKPITLIIGQNGTAKSTLLGMLAQPFSFGSMKDKEEDKRKLDISTYLSNYHGLWLSDYVDIAGNIYTYPCDKVFRLSKEHDTPDKRYLYETKLSGLDFSIDVNSPLKAKRLLTVGQTRYGRVRFVTGPGNNESVSHNSGEGNFPHPVIYLSLGRLLPLAEIKTCDISSGQGKLSAEESNRYVAAYKQIFSVVEETPKSGFMDTKEKKRSVVPLTDSYDGESCSAGQDNIGRLLTALLSFRRLKNRLGERYRGGLLLIDEIDATLHPASQIQLMRILIKEADDLSLQVVGTTHSLYLAETCLRECKKSVAVIQIKKNGMSLDVNSHATEADITADLKNIAIPPSKAKKKRKVSVVLEDGEAIKLFKFLLNKNPFLKRRISIANIKGKRTDNKPACFSGEYLQIFANNANKIPELRNVVFVPDGDMNWARESKNSHVVALPGDKALEVQLFLMLKNLPSDSIFWMGNPSLNYRKNVAIGNYTELAAQEVPDTNAAKKWYRVQKPHWGRSLSFVFEEYYKHHKEACDKFLMNLEKAVSICEQNHM